MKIEMREHDGCFEFCFEPETMDDSVQLVRFGLNATKDVRSKQVCAYQDGALRGYLVIGAKKSKINSIP